VRKNARLPPGRTHADGSYNSHIYASETDRRHKTNGIAVRFINYTLDGVQGPKSYTGW
jgi:hypothetical protein